MGAGESVDSNNNNTESQPRHTPVSHELVSHSKDDLTFSAERSEVIFCDSQVCLKSRLEIHLYCKNGQPYRLTERDTYRCEVVIGSSPICCVTDTTWNHKIIVSFNSTLAGVYKVTARVNRLLIGDRTYIHEYRPGPPHPSKTTFHLNGTAIVQELKHNTIKMVLRDMFGNITSGPLCVSIKKKNSTETPCVFPEKECKIDWMIASQGLYTGTIKYNQRDELVTFDIICLSENDMEAVNSNLYEGKKAEYTADGYIIKLCLTTIKVYKKCWHGKEKIYSFRVCPSTKIIVDNNNRLQICDEGGTSVDMHSKHSTFIAAMYHRYHNLGEIRKCSANIYLFYRELQMFYPRDHAEFVTKISVFRQHLLQSTFEATRTFQKEDWLKRFVVTFIGEEGNNAGESSTTFLKNLGELCFSSQLMFRTIDLDGYIPQDQSYRLPQNAFMHTYRFGIVVQQEPLLHPCKASVDLSFYKFAGRVMGKFIHECAQGRPLMTNARFTRSFLVQILGLKVTSECLEKDWCRLYDAFRCSWDWRSSSGLFFPINGEFDRNPIKPEPYTSARRNWMGQMVHYPKQDHLIPVTEKNKKEFLTMLVEYTMVSSVKNEIAAFIEGLNELVPQELLISMLDVKDLELLMRGTEY